MKIAWPYTARSNRSCEPATKHEVASPVALRTRGWFQCLVLLLVSSWSTSQAHGSSTNVTAGTEAYLSTLKPLLRSRCYACHGALKQKAELRLDTVEAMRRGGKSGPALVPGDAGRSRLFQRVTATDLTERMPPEHEGEPFSAPEQALLARWINDGAHAPAHEPSEADPQTHWAFQPIRRPPLPSGDHPSWARNAIDVFVAAGQQRAGLTPQAEASPNTLLRRVYFDLIGLPPTPDEIVAYERDDSPQAYERVVHRLLADPRHGERWARHWMDVWRYSDWWGLGAELRNSQKHIHHWRDWIVESLNANLPYDQMLRLMLAADELAPDDLGALRATGYLARNWFLFNRNQWMDETVEHVGKAFLGLTLNCAKCHDHKYDPIAQTDYYRFRAFFEPYHVRRDLRPGEADAVRDAIPRAFDGLLNPPTYRFVRGDESRPDTNVVMAPGVPAMFAFAALQPQPVALPKTAWQPARRPWVLAAHLDAAQARCVQAEARWQEAKTALDAAADPAAPTSTNLVGAARAASRTNDVDLAERQAQARLAEAALALAHADRSAIVARAEAMKAAWRWEDAAAHEDRSPLQEHRRQTARAAVQAEKKLGIAQTRHGVAAAQDQVRRATAGKKEEAEKALTQAQSAATKAEADLLASGAEEQFTPLAGALWTPTRFLESRQDDPAIPFPPESSGRRSALAAWMTDARNPLTARVAVNQMWLRHFGVPLVEPTFDLGRKGPGPVLPHLLDWLAAELIEHGWDMKHLHRLIALSATYRLSSNTRDQDENLRRDPDNRFWWRRLPARLEAQVIRDSLLAHAGILDRTMSGPAVPPAEQEQSHRRSLYFFHSNNERNLFLSTFDDARVTECYRREQSIVPQQALALANSRLVDEVAPRIARQIERTTDDALEPDRAFVRAAFSVLLGTAASTAEESACLDALQAWRRQAGVARPSKDKSDESRDQLIWALINHNDFVTVR